MLGGVLGGLGLGWLFDHFAHSSPWGVIVGVLAGAAASVVIVVRTAMKLSERASAKSAPASAAPDDEDEA